MAQGDEVRRPNRGRMDRGRDHRPFQRRSAGFWRQGQQREKDLPVMELVAIKPQHAALEESALFDFCRVDPVACTGLKNLREVFDQYVDPLLQTRNVHPNLHDNYVAFAALWVFLNPLNGSGRFLPQHSLHRLTFRRLFLAICNHEVPEELRTVRFQSMWDSWPEDEREAFLKEHGHQEWTEVEELDEDGGDFRRFLSAVEKWRGFLPRSTGTEDRFDKRCGQACGAPADDALRGTELQPGGTRTARHGKSHIYQQVSPYSHLVSGGKATVAKRFVNNANGQRGLICLYDVVCFDEVSEISFDSKDSVNIMKGYMASGEFSRGKDKITAEGGIVMVGNFDVDVKQQQRIGHLLGPLPPEMRNDTAFHDRIHAFAPDWDSPKLNPDNHLTVHHGLVGDFLSEYWSKIRPSSRTSVMQGRAHLGETLSGRDFEAVNKTVSGLMKLLYPDPEMQVPDEELEDILRLALESRRRVKEKQKQCLKSEFRNTLSSFTLGAERVEQFVSAPELHSDDTIEGDPLPPGQVFALSPGGPDSDVGLYRIEVTVGPGGGVKILNTPAPEDSARA